MNVTTCCSSISWCATFCPLEELRRHSSHRYDLSQISYMHHGSSVEFGAQACTSSCSACMTLISVQSTTFIAKSPAFPRYQLATILNIHAITCRAIHGVSWPLCSELSYGLSHRPATAVVFQCPGLVWCISGKTARVDVTSHVTVRTLIDPRAVCHGRSVVSHHTRASQQTWLQTTKFNIH